MVNLRPFLNIMLTFSALSVLKKRLLFNAVFYMIIIRRFHQGMT